MNFPKQFMTIAELSEMGLSPKMLRKMYHQYGYPLAFTEVNSATAPIKFNTKLLDKQLKRQNERRT